MSKTKSVPWPVAEGYVAEGGTWRGLRWQITRRAEPSIVRVEHACRVLRLVPEQAELRVSAVGSGAVRIYKIDDEPILINIGGREDRDLAALADLVGYGSALLAMAATRRVGR